MPKSDRAAVGLAMQRCGGQVHAYCLHDDAEALRYALAAGAASATRVADVEAINADVVLVGSGGAEPWGDLLPALLAAHRQCAMVLEVLDVASGPHGMTVTRALGRGSREVLAMSGPAVLGIAEEAPQLLYVSRYRRQAVRAALLAPHTGSARQPRTTVGDPWELARPRVKTGNLATKTAATASARLQALQGLSTGTAREDEHAHIITADATTCARHLLRFLRHHGIIAASTPSPTAPAASATVENTVAHSTPAPSQPPWAPHRRGPRPLQGERRGMARRPRPRPPDVASPPQAHAGIRPRSPRPVGQDTSQQRRGPRPVDMDPAKRET
jgi:electron transfer flavoprotein alpha/beta subunit